jgi:hypothetical protein
MARIGGDHHVLNHAHAVERADELESASEPKSTDVVRPHAVDPPAVEDDPAGRGWDQTGQAVEQCRLAGAVRTDDAEDLTAVDREADIGERLEAAEGPAEIRDLDKHLAHARGPIEEG